MVAGGAGHEPIDASFRHLFPLVKHVTSPTDHQEDLPRDRGMLMAEKGWSFEAPLDAVGSYSTDGSKVPRSA